MVALVWCMTALSVTGNNKDISKPADMVPPTARSSLSNPFEADTIQQEVTSWHAHVCSRGRSLPVGNLTSTRMQLYGDYLWSTSDSMSFVSQIAAQSSKASFVWNHKSVPRGLLNLTTDSLTRDMTQAERSNLTLMTVGEIEPDDALYDPGIGIVSVIPGRIDHDDSDRGQTLTREIAHTQTREILKAAHFVNLTPLELVEQVPFELLSSDLNGFESRTRNHDPSCSPYFAMLARAHLSSAGWFNPYYIRYTSEDMELHYPSITEQVSFEIAVLMVMIALVITALAANALSCYFGSIVPDLVAVVGLVLGGSESMPFCPIDLDAGATDRNVYFVHFPPCFRCENVMGALLLLRMLCFASTHSQPISYCFPNPIGSKAKYSSFIPGCKGSGDGEHHRPYRYPSTYSVVSSVNPSRFELIIILTILMGHTYAAGKDHPNQTLNENFLPGVLRWDGEPFHTFRSIWYVALTVALGTIAQDGWTLLQTARDQDQGGPALGGTAAQQVQSSNRNQRLFACILNYIEPTCYLYRYVSANFANNGRGLFNYIYVFGHLPYSADKRQRMQNEWEEAKMWNVGIKYKPNAVFKWAEYLFDLGTKLGKTNREMRVKYLEGFPDAFDVVIIPERQLPGMGSYTHPTNYPAHHPSAGNPHPDAGTPDIMAMAHAFYAEWSRMISAGKIKAVPKGMANFIDRPQTSKFRRNPKYGKQKARAAQQSDQESSDESQGQNDYDDGEVSDQPQPQANLVKSKVTALMVCLTCGGLGHASNVEGVGECLTRRLNSQVSKSHLLAIKYPEGIKRPVLSTPFKHKTVRRVRTTDTDTEAEEASAKAVGPSRRRFPPKRPGKGKRPQARQVEEELSDEDPPQEQANTDSSEDVGEVEELAVRYAYIQA